MKAVLAAAGIEAELAATEVVAVGTRGLNIRGPRDEDGTHARLRIDDGRTFIYREYSPTSTTDVYVEKESAVFGLLRSNGLPAPQVLARRPHGDEPAALLLSDMGGDPLEAVFCGLADDDAASLWASVGVVLRGLHSVAVEEAAFLRAPVYQRPWTKPVPYFVKTLPGVRDARPAVASATAALRSLRGPLQEWLDSRPQAVSFGPGYYPIPGLLVERDGRRWRCRSWLSLGYYVWITDPARDVVAMNLGHKEWTGRDLPDAFFAAYGSRPDPLATLVYEMFLQLPRAAAYARGATRAGREPPPHSGVLRALDELPATVERIRAALS